MREFALHAREESGCKMWEESGARVEDRMQADRRRAARKAEREFFDFFRTVRYTWHYSEIRFHTLFLRSSSVANRKMKIEYFSLLSVQYSLSMNVYYVRKEEKTYIKQRALKMHEQHMKRVYKIRRVY